MLGILGWQLPAVLSWGLTQFLQQQGLTHITVEISDVDASQTLIKQLDVTYAESDTELRMQFGPIRLEYSLSELINGQAQNLLIDSVAIKLDHQPGPQMSTSPTLPSIDILLEAYKAVDHTVLPINTIQLPNISFSHNLASDSVTTFDVIELGADLSKLENKLTTKVVFANQQALHWTIDAKSGWNVQLFDTPNQPQETQPREAVLNIGLNQIDQSLVFSADAKPRLAEYMLLFTTLGDHSIDFDQVMVNGTIKAAESVAGLSRSSGLAVSSKVKLSDLEYENERIQTLDGQFDLQIAQTSVESKKSEAPWELDITFNNGVSLTNASFANWRADKVMISASGDLSLTEDVSKFTSSDLLVNVGTLKQANELELNETIFSGAGSMVIDAQQWQLDLAEAWELTSQYARMDETELPQGFSLRSSDATRLINTFGTVSSIDAQVEDDAARLELDAERLHSEYNGSEPVSSDSMLLQQTSLTITMPVAQNTSEPRGIREVDAVLQIDKARFDQGQWSANGSLSIPQLEMFDNSVAALAQTQNAENQALNHQALNNQVLNSNGNNLPLSNFKQSFTLADDVLTSRGSVDSIERNLHITTISEHNLKREQGETAFGFETIEFNDTERLNQLTSPIALPAKLVAGELELSGKARWAHKHDGWQATVDLDTQLVNIGGAYDETYFSGINAKLSLQVYPDIVSEKMQRLSIAHIDVGVVNTDTVVEFTLKPSNVGELPVVNLLLAKTELLQGNMSLKPGAYDLNRAVHKLQVVMENINLSELVRLQQLDDIEATGLVTGELPIIVDNGEVSIDNGQLQAIAPGGILRYQADADTLKGNAYAETVVQVLSNFNYEALRADTHYDPDGTLLLKLQLQGHNPDYEQGRQVNLNINLEQNILKLFESVRLIDGVSDTLDKRVKDFYQRTTSQ